jgi:hypothetical protein
MTLPTFYDRVRQPLADLNHTLTACRVSANALTRDCQTSRRPFMLHTLRGDFISRFASLDTATAAARRYDAAVDRARPITTQETT